MEVIAVTDNKMTTEQLVQTIIDIEPYMDAVILREKSKTDHQLINLIQTLLASGINSSKIIVHGRIDIAYICGIQKIQLPGHGIPLQLAREHFPSLSFGRSVHGFTEAKTAAEEGADWLLYGHLFPTSSKEGLPPRGTSELSQIIDACHIPVYGLGGIKTNHISQLKILGLSGIAVMSSIFSSNRPATAAKSYKE